MNRNRKSGGALSQFVYHDAETYEEMAQELSVTLRRVVIATLILGVINIILLAVLNSLGFRPSKPGQWVDLSSSINSLLSFGRNVTPLLVLSTVGSFIVAMLVMIVSYGFRNAVKEHFHALASIVPYPIAISAIITVGVLLLLLVVILVEFTIQLILGLFLLAAMIGALTTLGR